MCFTWIPFNSLTLFLHDHKEVSLTCSKINYLKVFKNLMLSKRKMTLLELLNAIRIVSTHKSMLFRFSVFNFILFHIFYKLLWLLLGFFLLKTKEIWSWIEGYWQSPRKVVERHEGHRLKIIIIFKILKNDWAPKSLWQIKSDSNIFFQPPF